MKYLKRFNESLNEDWDLEEIKDIFQDFLDEGFTLDDVSVGSSLTIAPKLWCPSHEDFSGNKSFPSVTINNMTRILTGDWGGNGGTYSLSNSEAGLIINLNAGGSVTSFNVIMPDSPVNGQVVKIVDGSYTTFAIGTLTMVGSGYQSVYGATVSNLGTTTPSASWVYDLVDSIWFRL